jgi:hypothetical protein
MLDIDIMAGLIVIFTWDVEMLTTLIGESETSARCTTARMARHCWIDCETRLVAILDGLFDRRHLAHETFVASQ